MLYTFYNKNIPILDINYDESFGFSKIKKIHNPEYVPFGLYIPKYNKYGIYFKDWWSNRLLPLSRQNFDVVNVNISDIAIKNFGLSLSDQYWFCPKEMKDIRWSDVNFFQNDFEFDYNLDQPFTSLSSSPNTSTNGDLPKKWIIEDSVRYLCKGYSEVFEQEAINECIASEILETIKVKHVPYFYRDGYSWCSCFVDENTEFIPAWNIYKSQQKKNNENDFFYFQRVLDALELPYKDKIDSMLIFDYIIANQDRHFNNFGFLRDVSSLKFIDFAPLFDNGNSLWYRKKDSQIGLDVSCKPFVSNFDKQMSYIQDKSVIDLSYDFSEIMQSIFSKYGFARERSIKICHAVQERQKNIMKMIG